jgi:hypothetical protein
MLFTRTSAMLVGGGLLAAVLVSPALMRSPTPTSVGPSRPFVTEAPGTFVAPDRIAALRAQQQARPQQTPAVRTSRNPFVFASREDRTDTRPVSGPALVVAPPSAPPRPPLLLSAIADETIDSTVVRTAILSIGGQVFLAKEGDRPIPRFLVVRITADVVELRDETDGAQLRLALR